MTPELKELLMQIHDKLHKGEVRDAHELMHKALGVDHEPVETAAPLAHRFDFDQAFRTACRKNGVKAMYLLIDDVDDGGRARLLSGGDAELCELVKQQMRGGS